MGDELHDHDGSGAVSGPGHWQRRRRPTGLGMQETGQAPDVALLQRLAASGGVGGWS
jgi:hypothetical protein